MARTIRASMMQHDAAGFTLVEMMLGAAVLTIVAVALLGSYFGQAFLSANARNLTAAMNDATRIMEQIRQQNTSATEPCKSTNLPTIAPPAVSGATSWDVWLNGQGKSVGSGTNVLELVAVTCQDEAGQNYCGRVGGAGNPANPPAQVGAAEWKTVAVPTSFNPIRVTVAIGWRQHQRAMGQVGGRSEFIYTTSTPTNLTVADTDGDGVIGSQAMVTTLVTCR